MTATEIGTTPHWYALYTRPRFEKKIDQSLKEKKVESYVPLQTVVRQWSDRRKKVLEPLFTCYVFVRIPWKSRMLAVQTHGVIRMVSFGNGPSPIPDEEIDAIRRILEGGHPFEKVDFLEPGQRVEVVHGVFAGLRGRLIEYRGRRRLLIAIEQIRQGLCVEVNDWDVRVTTTTHRNVIAG